MKNYLVIFLSKCANEIPFIKRVRYLSTDVWSFFGWKMEIRYDSRRSRFTIIFADIYIYMRNDAFNENSPSVSTTFFSFFLVTIAIVFNFIEQPFVPEISQKLLKSSTFSMIKKKKNPCPELVLVRDNGINYCYYYYYYIDIRQLETLE